MRASGEFDMLMRQATGISKAPYVAQFVKMLLESEDKVVVYAWHRAVYDLLMHAWTKSGFRPQLFTGSESPTQKAESVKQFVLGKSRILLMSLRAGQGLDGLQAVTRTVVHAELDWSPGVAEQCDGRVYRDGQADPVMSYYLMAEDGADPFIASVLGLKRGQIGGVRDPNLPLFEMVDKDSVGGIREMAEQYLRKAERG
jgi:SNF2 family DNA or RNA helicase